MEKAEIKGRPELRPVKRGRHHHASAVWQLVVSLGLVNERMLPAPTQIFETLMYKFANKAPDGNVLWVNILASLQVALSGFLAAIIIGVPLGLVMAGGPMRTVSSVPSLSW